MYYKETSICKSPGWAKLVFGWASPDRRAWPAAVGKYSGHERGQTDAAALT